MRIVVVGNGKVGQNIVSNLSKEGHDLIIIENDQKIVEDMINKYDVYGICGNGASLEIQQEANVKDADLVVAVTSSDEINLLTCFIAHKLGAKDTIARVRDPEYIKQIEFMQEDLGLSMTINPEYEAANTIMNNLAFPSASSVESFANGKMQLVGYKIPNDSILNGLSLFELSSKFKVKLLVCAVERGEEVIIPVGDFVLEANDRIHIAASHDDLINFFTQLNNNQTKKIKDIMILGAGRIPYYFCQIFAKNKYDIKVIDSDDALCNKFAEDFSKIDVVKGDPTDQDLLTTEGIDDVDAFLALTGKDEQNIIASIFANKKKAKKIITEVNNSSLNTMMESIGMASVFSTRDLIADRVLSYIRAKENTRGSNIKTLYQLVNKKVAALEFVVKTKKRYIGWPIKKLHLKKNMLIAGIIRNGEVIIPNGNDCMQLNDSVIVISTNLHLEDLKQIFRI